MFHCNVLIENYFNYKVIFPCDDSEAFISKKDLFIDSLWRRMVEFVSSEENYILLLFF